MNARIVRLLVAIAVAIIAVIYLVNQTHHASNQGDKAACEDIYGVGLCSQDTNGHWVRTGSGGINDNP